MKIFIGYDSREEVAYNVCRYSILSKQSKVNIIPLKQEQLISDGLYSRPVDNLASTEFTYTRFLIPELTKFKGWALFIDCDTLVTTDIQQLFDQVNDQYAVMCVQHDYDVSSRVKMDGRVQTQYPRKNWSSVVLWNCAHPSNRVVTKDLVNDPKIAGSYLHRFSWLKDEEIGSLHHTWNYLVGVYDDIENPNLIHYTEGGPWFKGYEDCQFADLWYTAHSKAGL